MANGERERDAHTAIHRRTGEREAACDDYPSEDAIVSNTLRAAGPVQRPAADSTSALHCSRHHIDGGQETDGRQEAEAEAAR